MKVAREKRDKRHDPRSSRAFTSPKLNLNIFARSLPIFPLWFLLIFHLSQTHRVATPRFEQSACFAYSRVLNAELGTRKRKRCSRRLLRRRRSPCCRWGKRSGSGSTGFTLVAGRGLARIMHAAPCRAPLPSSGTSPVADPPRVVSVALRVVVSVRRAAVRAGSILRGVCVCAASTILRRTDDASSAGRRASFLLPPCELLE